MRCEFVTLHRAEPRLVPWYLEFALQDDVAMFLEEYKRISTRMEYYFSAVAGIEVSASMRASDEAEVLHVGGGAGGDGPEDTAVEDACDDKRVEADAFALPADAVSVDIEMVDEVPTNSEGGENHATPSQGADGTASGVEAASSDNNEGDEDVVKSESVHETDEDNDDGSCDQRMTLCTHGKPLKSTTTLMMKLIMMVHATWIWMSLGATTSICDLLRRYTLAPSKQPYHILGMDSNLFELGSCSEILFWTAIDSAHRDVYLV